MVLKSVCRLTWHSPRITLAEAVTLKIRPSVSTWVLLLRDICSQYHISYLSWLTLLQIRLKPMHTYLIMHYQPSVRIMSLVSYTTYVACINFIHEWRTIDFLSNFSWQFYLLLQSFCQKSVERQWPKKSFFILRYVRYVWPRVWIVASRLICQHDHFKNMTRFILKMISYRKYVIPESSQLF